MTDEEMIGNTLISNPDVMAKKCWIFNHKWSKWIVTSRSNSLYLCQSRRCERCGITKVKRESFWLF